MLSSQRRAWDNSSIARSVATRGHAISLRSQKRAGRVRWGSSSAQRALGLLVGQTAGSGSSRVAHHPRSCWIVRPGRRSLWLTPTIERRGVTVPMTSSDTAPLHRRGGRGRDRSRRPIVRPDVQGLRAVAILLVVLFHAAIPGFTGGYVGVDVFFVISGFVITGVLLRERVATQRTSILTFYGRRARRIIPAASLVIIVTVIAAFHYLGPLTGHATAVDGRWAAIFLANFHFAAEQTNYLASQQPPSALQNFWSLAVEEQFYIVYPTLFLIVAHWPAGSRSVAASPASWLRSSSPRTPIRSSSRRQTPRVLSSRL